MNLILDGIVIAGLFAIFGISHSVLASNKVKRWILQKYGNKIAFYRLFYNLFSTIIFLAVYYFSPKPDVYIYDLDYPYDIIILILQILSLAGFLWAVSFVDAKEFLGITQIKRYFNGTYNPGELDERLTFIVRGPFHYSRHPIYFFSILFLGLRPQMDFFYLIFFLAMTAYFVIGSKFEEKKLIERFGVRYIDYKKNVPAIVPYKIFTQKYTGEKNEIT